MHKELSLNTKLAIQKARLNWKKLREIASSFHVHINTVSRYVLPYEPKWLKHSQRLYYEKNRETIIARVKNNYHNKKSLSFVWK